MPEKNPTPSSSLIPSVGGLLAAFIVLGSWSAVNWKSQSDWSSRVVEFERYKTVEEGKLREKELSLEKQKIELDAAKKELETNGNKLIVEQSKLTNLTSSIREREIQVLQAAQTVGAEAQIAREQAELNSLTSQVAQLGVNLKGDAPCDPSELRRYNQGKALIDQIVTRARAAGLWSKYSGFVASNTANVISLDHKCK